MTEEEKLLAMFHAVHGEITGSCKAVAVVVDDINWGEGETRVEVIKDGHVCWSKSKLDVLFDYMTKTW